MGAAEGLVESGAWGEPASAGPCWNVITSVAARDMHISHVSTCLAAARGSSSTSCFSSGQARSGWLTMTCKTRAWRIRRRARCKSTLAAPGVSPERAGNLLGGKAELGDHDDRGCVPGGEPGHAPFYLLSELGQLRKGAGPGRRSASSEVAESSRMVTLPRVRS